MIRALLTLALMLMSISSHAYFRDGNTLLRQLESDNAAERVSAMGYVSGAFDMINEVDILINRESKRYLFCQPDNITLGQIVDIVKAYLRSNPEIRHKPAAELVMGALRRSFPCAEPAAPQRNRNSL